MTFYKGKEPGLWFTFDVTKHSLSLGFASYWILIWWGND
jgi:hypothetical protein